MRIAIIGAGIGGLTSANALVRGGHDVTVYERSDELREVGAGIWVPTNAMQALARLDLAEPIASAGIPVQRIEAGPPMDRPLQALDLDDVVERFGYPTISLHRSRLQAELARPLGVDVIELGRACVGFEARGDRVEVRFESGEPVECDLLVAADGLHSAIRAQLMPRQRLRYSGQMCYRGLAQMQLPDDERRLCRELWMGRLRFGYAAIGADTVYWFAPMAGVRADAPSLSKAELLGEYGRGRVPTAVLEVIEATDTAHILRTPLHDFAPITQWVHGRVVLLGDAAHATTPNLGQGGAQAIEDAYILGEAIARRPDPADVVSALADYQRARMDKARFIVNTSWRMGKIAHWRNPLMRAARDLGMRLTPRNLIRRQLDRVYTLSKLPPL